MSNPYQAFEDYRFWRRSVSRTEPHLFDPVVAPRFAIAAGDRIATAGSCFAQHISRKLGEIGFNYFVPEDGAALEAAERRRRNYGVFSARFGNLYTTTQLRQLFEEACGARVPHERAWRRPDGRWIDPYRPQIEPDGFGSAEEVLRERATHLDYVRQAFTECDVLVFTLGLTEAWRSTRDGSVFPIAPGVVAEGVDRADYEPVNFELHEVAADLAAFLERLRATNPSVRVLLTVSPVPLIATFEDRNVLVSTTYSKAVLRVAADMTIRRFDWVDYFPSYEIITGSNNGGRYYEADHREVNRLGVAHAMRCFVKNYVAGRRGAEAAGAIAPALRDTTKSDFIVCDEEVLDLLRR